VPEGDTVYRAATKLREALAGKALTRCDVRVPKFATVDLTGSVVDEVLSRGKHLFIRAGDASIHSHLNMDGSSAGRSGAYPRTRSESSWKPQIPGRQESTSACWRF
jgi:formamidopyrimidine-DNA glycosylase